MPTILFRKRGLLWGTLCFIALIGECLYIPGFETTLINGKRGCPWRRKRKTADKPGPDKE